MICLPPPRRFHPLLSNKKRCKLQNLSPSGEERIEEEERGKRKEERGKRKEERGKRKEERGKRKEERGKSEVIQVRNEPFSYARCQGEQTRGQASGGEQMRRTATPTTAHRQEAV
jgi:hypothetical protein